VQDALGAVDVGEEQIQRADTLNQAALDETPLLGGDEARDRIEGEHLLDARVVRIHREGDALISEQELDQLPSLLDFRRAELVESDQQVLVERSNAPRLGERLVVAARIHLVLVEAHRRKEAPPPASAAFRLRSVSAEPTRPTIASRSHGAEAGIFRATRLPCRFTRLGLERRVRIGIEQTRARYSSTDDRTSSALVER